MVSGKLVIKNKALDARLAWDVILNTKWRKRRA
jgi:hypothetical protein